MITIKEIEEEFEKKLVTEWVNQIDLDDINEAKKFLHSKLLEVAESIVPERATERNTNKVSETWTLHGEAEVDGWNACVSQISDNIEKMKL